jgi:ribosome-associated toxin RatA of RatAB toxin-antitoxin module
VRTDFHQVMGAPNPLHRKQAVDAQRRALWPGRRSIRVCVAAIRYHFAIDLRCERLPAIRRSWSQGLYRRLSGHWLHLHGWPLYHPH